MSEREGDCDHSYWNKPRWRMSKKTRLNLRRLDLGLNNQIRLELLQFSEVFIGNLQELQTIPVSTPALFPSQIFPYDLG